MFATDHEKVLYLFGSAIVWVAIFLGTAVVLSGTDYFVKLLPVELVGVVWSIVLVPLYWRFTKKSGEH